MMHMYRGRSCRQASVITHQSRDSADQRGRRVVQEGPEGPTRANIVWRCEDEDGVMWPGHTPRLRCGGSREADGERAGKRPSPKEQRVVHLRGAE